MAILNHALVAPGDSPAHWLYLLHGIYGSGRNWGSVARRLTERRPGWGVVLVDLRLHGASRDFYPPHTVRACAGDLAQLEEHLGLPASALLGHSFGGKVALIRAGEEPEPPGQVWVVDSTLRTGEPSGSAWEIIEIVRSLPETFRSRDELVDAIAGHGYARGVGQWLAMNLERAGEEFRWRLDWDGIEALLRDYFATDVWSVIENESAPTHLHFIKAAASNAIDDETLRRLHGAGERTGRVHVHTVEGGHWLNVDNPEGVESLLEQLLPE